MKQQNNQIEWKEVKLREIALVDSGQGAPQGENYFNGEDIFIRAGDLNNLTNNLYVGDYCEKITEEAIKKYKLKKYKKGSIVFPKSGMSVNTGNIAITKENSYIVNHLAIIEPLEQISNLFLFYLLKNIGISHLSRDSSYPSIRIYDIKDMRIFLPFSNGKPNLKEQERIVSILEKAEKQKERGKNANELLDEYLKSVFNEMFYNKGFEEIKLREICEINPKKSEIGEEDNNLEVSFVPMADISEHNIHFKSKETRRIKEVYKGYTYFKEEDILLAKVTPCFENGKSGICKNLKNRIGFGSSEYHVLRPTKNILPEIIYYVISSEAFIKLGEKQLTGTGGLRRLPKYFVDNFKIPLPPIPLQQKFAKIVEQVESMKENVKKTKLNSEELFNSLMQKAFRGEL